MGEVILQIPSSLWPTSHYENTKNTQKTTTGLPTGK
jgi:hypothetical protein